MENLLSRLALCKEPAVGKVTQSTMFTRQRGLLYKSFRLFFRVLFYGKGGEYMSPISLFKAGVMFGLTIYTIAKKGFMDDKMRA
ncbi:hypothetical protein GA0061087_10924 [Priestia flexa]|nr:hypothetical protein GA0061087_10924 [Priestia flexa]